MERSGEVDGDAVAGFLFAVEMALQFDIDVLGAEDAEESIDLTARFFRTALVEGCG